MDQSGITGNEVFKSYYLPRWRSLTIGIILIMFGLALNFIGISTSNSLWFNIQRILLSFESLGDFLFSLLALAFKLGFILGGYIYIKYSDSVERARLDNKGFYYREIPKGSNANKVAMDAGPLTFSSYQSIHDIVCKKSFWSGTQLYLTLDSGAKALPALGVLTDDQKNEIVSTVKNQINLHSA